MLRACGAAYEDGSLDRMFIAEVIAIASGDKTLGKMILEFVAKHYRKELKKILGIVPEKVVLKWDQGFEDFLGKRKRRQLAGSPSGDERQMLAIGRVLMGDPSSSYSTSPLHVSSDSLTPL